MARVTELREYGELLYFLVLRNVKLRYKQTALGMVWVVLQPLLTAAFFTIVFGRIAGLPSDGMPYPLFAFAGLLPWNFFATSVTRAVSSIPNDAELISKVYFPRLILPLAAVVSTVLDLAVNSAVLMCMAAWYGIVPSWTILSAPFLLLLTGAAALAVSLWLAPLNARYRDVGHAMPFLMQVWLFASPVAYSITLVSDMWKPIYSLNPMTGIVEAFRWSILGTGHFEPTVLLVSACVVIVVATSGLVFFTRQERTLADVI